jgi:glutathione S-transferase
MITVHHLNNSRSQRVLWLLEELGVPYEIRRYERDAKTMLAPPALKQVHPLGKSPVITDGDITVAETGAIVEYLLDTYDDKGALRPVAGSAARRRFTYWLHYAEGSAMTPLLLALVFGRVASAPMPFFVRPVARGIAAGAMKSFVQPQIDLHLDYMEAELAAAPWFAGDKFSAADIQMSFPLEAAASRGGLDGRRKQLMAFLERIHARPASKRALEAGGPYELMR